MARKHRKPRAARDKITSAPADESVLESYLDKKAAEEYYAYSVAVIEDRAIYGEIDGLKPVTRRALWATHELGLHSRAAHDKSAKIVGAAMGNYHPHGDSALYGAVVTAANSPMALIDGKGNWGTMTDPAAAMRYTNARLSRYADACFFDKFYLPVMDTVDNYDGSRKEPLILPTLLPNALLNGNFGIAPGVQTSTPTITLESLVPVLIQTLKAKGHCEPGWCRDLELVTSYGGKMRHSKESKREMRNFINTGRGRFLFDSLYDETGSHEIRFSHFAPFSNIEAVLGKVESIKGVTGTRDDSDKKDKYKVAYVVTFSKSLNGPPLAHTTSKVVDAFSAYANYRIQVTERFLDKERPDGGKRLKPSTVPKLIESWVKYRILLEKKACRYWVGKRKEQIAYQRLLLLAVANRKLIIQALDKKMNDAQLAEYLAKLMKITVEQANVILDLKIRQLKKLESETINAKIRELKQEAKGFIRRFNKPAQYIAKNVEELALELSKTT